MKTHWFPLLRPAIKPVLTWGVYFLGEGGVGWLTNAMIVTPLHQGGLAKYLAVTHRPGREAKSGGSDARRGGEIVNLDAPGLVGGLSGMTN